MTRRNFTLFSLASLAVAGGAGFLISKIKAKTHLRPPGAVKNFESLCVKCGQCVQVCPYHSIGLLGLDDGLNLGTAYIDASKRGCYLCDLFPCVLACPSGALSHDTNTINDVKMGVAVVKSLDKCFAYNAKSVENSHIEHLLARKTYNEREARAKEILSENLGKNCELCVNSCPVNGALVFENLNENLGENFANSSVNLKENSNENSRLKGENSVNFNENSQNSRNLQENSTNLSENSQKNSRKIVVVKESCVGCGVCQEVCFAGVIEILPQVNYDEFYLNSQKG